MKKRKKPFLPEASPKIWRSNKRTTSELHQTIWHFLQVLTHCNYHQFHKSPAPHWMAHHAKWKMILGQSDHLLSRARNIETHFVLFLEIYFILTVSLTKPIKMLRLWSHCWDFIEMCFSELYWKTFHWLKIFIFLLLNIQWSASTNGHFLK